MPIREENLFLVQSFFDDQTPFVEEPVTLKLSSDEKEIVDQYQGPKIMVCPGSNWPNKQMDPEALTQFLEQLSANFVFIWGNAQELEEVKRLAAHFPESLILPKYSLPLLQNLMKKMELVIAMDSLPLHLAGTAGVPTFAIFGPSSAAKYNPPGKLHVAYQGSCPYGRTFSRRCPILRTCPTGLCTRDISADTLYSRFKVLPSIREEDRLNNK